MWNKKRRIFGIANHYSPHAEHNREQTPVEKKKKKRQRGKLLLLTILKQPDVWSGHHWICDWTQPQTQFQLLWTKSKSTELCFETMNSWSANPVRGAGTMKLNFARARREARIQSHKQERQHLLSTKMAWDYGTAPSTMNFSKETPPTRKLNGCQVWT